MSNNTNSIRIENGIRIIDIFIIPNSLSLATEDNTALWAEISNNRVGRLNISDDWKIRLGDYGVQVWAVGSPHDCAERDAHSNLTDHGLDDDLVERLGLTVEDEDGNPSFLSFMPLRMISTVKENDIVPLTENVHMRFTQLPYRYSRFGNIEETLTSLRQKAGI